MRDLSDVITPLSTLEKLQQALLKNKELQAQMARMEMQISTQADTIRKLYETRQNMTDLLAMALPYVECQEQDSGYKPGVVARQARMIRAAIEGA